MALQEFIHQLVARSGAAGLSRHFLVGNGRFALNFHGVSRQRYLQVAKDLQPHHSVPEFQATLAWLSARFSFLTVDEFLYDTCPGVLLTFDDGHANNLTNILPLLEVFKAQGLFFVSAQHVKSPRNWLSFTRKDARRGWGDEQAVPDDFARDCYDGLSVEQLATLAKSPWAVIGGHTDSHPDLAILDESLFSVELEESRRYLQAISGQSVDFFAYPYGNYTLSVTQAVRTAGYKAAFAVDPNPVGIPHYEIPRVGIYASDPSYLAMKLSGIHRPALHHAVLPGV